jgi:hypothetical protein
MSVAVRLLRLDFLTIHSPASCMRNTQVFITRFMLHFSKRLCGIDWKVDDDFQVWSPNAFMFDCPSSTFFYLFLCLFEKKVMSLESILFARLVVGDDGGDLEQPQSYKKEVSKRKEKMYTQTGYFAGWVHHRPCWRHSRKPVFFFFFFVCSKPFG